LTDEIEIYNNGTNKMTAVANEHSFDSVLTCFDCAVEVWGFAGNCSIYVYKNEIDSLVKRLQQMNERLTGEVTIESREDAYYLKFRFIKNVLQISGKMEVPEACSLVFKFDADQTAIIPLITLLRKLQ